MALMNDKCARCKHLPNCGLNDPDSWKCDNRASADTDERKAMEIVDAVRKSVTPRYQLEDYKENYLNEVHDCCMTMAKWKQKEMIEKAVKWLKENEAGYWSQDYDTPRKLLVDFVNAMEE